MSDGWKFTPEQIEAATREPLDSESNWRLILSQLDELPWPDVYYDRCKDELRCRGFSEADIKRMQQFADEIVWPYIERLPYPEFHVDEETAERAILHGPECDELGENQRRELLAFFHRCRGTA
jgi:hypothetical protein